MIVAREATVRQVYVREDHDERLFFGVDFRGCEFFAGGVVDQLHEPVVHSRNG